MTSPHALENRTRALETDLDAAYRTILEMVPSEQLRDALKSYYPADPDVPGWAWREKLAQQVISAAVILPSGGSATVDRAYCPFCGQGASSPSDVGYALPEGLRRHLLGWGANSKNCEVMRAATSLANNYWNRSR